MNILSSISFLSNNDGEGFILRKNKKIKEFKSKRKILYEDVGDILISHQRLATSGKGVNNAHPHKIGEFLLMHNGVFHGKGNDEVSDTKMYFNELYKEIKRGGVIRAIKKVNLRVGGSYSVVLVNIKDGKFYYYKNGMTEMYIVEDKKYRVLSTREYNCGIAKLFLKMRKAKVKKVKSYWIYDLLRWKRLSKFKEKKEVVEVKSFGDYYSYFEDCPTKQTTLISEEREKLDVWEKKGLREFINDEILGGEGLNSTKELEAKCIDFVKTRIKKPINSKITSQILELIKGEVVKLLWV